MGWIKLKENNHLPFDKKILSATVSKRVGRWFVSISVEEEIAPVPNAKGEVIGIDLGIKTLAVASNGMVFENPKALKTYRRKLARLQRKQCRQKKGSSNRKKTNQKIARLHYKISNIRKNSIHKMTSAVVKTKPRLIVIEDLNVRGMTKNHCLAGAVSDASFGEIRRQLDYKCKWNAVELQVADRWFPSSKMCSRCGHIRHDLTLKDRIFVCPECGLVIDRDENASMNLKRYPTLSSRGSDACGEGCCKAPRKPVKGKKQELETTAYASGI